MNYPFPLALCSRKLFSEDEEKFFSALPGTIWRWSLFGSDECFGVFVRGGPEWLCLAATSPFILWGKLPGYPWALDCPSTTGRNFSLLGKNMGTGNRKQTADAGGNLEGKEEQHDKLGPGSGQSLLQQGSLSEETQSTKLLVFFLVTTGKGISEFAESQLEVPIKAFLTEVTLESRLWKYISNKNRKSAQVQDSHPPSWSSFTWNCCLWELLFRTVNIIIRTKGETGKQSCNHSKHGVRGWRNLGMIYMCQEEQGWLTGGKKFFESEQ